MKHFFPHRELNVAQVTFTLGADRNGKTSVNMIMQPQGCQVALVSSPAVTLWPRVTGDGNFGTMWGPTDITKAKFTLDLNDACINEAAGAGEPGQPATNNNHAPLHRAPRDFELTF